MKLFPAFEETLTGAGRQIRSGEQRAVELLAGCLQQIDALEPGIRAWVSVDRDGALRQAEACDREIAAGKYRGPLHGIPLGIKDIFDVAGFPTAAGSALLSKQLAEADCTVVSRLRAAGAVILGKTVTTQFASFDPSVTRNPWNAERTPGGSSSGSAAAVATGMCLGAIGSQTGGSITRPASFCGVAGCKPSFGRVSLHGVFPLAPSLDHPGPMGRTVRDLAILLDAVSGADPSDLVCLVEPPTNLSAALDSRIAGVPRLGRLRGMFQDLAAPSVRSAFDAAMDRLLAAGTAITAACLPGGFEHVILNHRRVMAVELAAYHEQRIQEHPEDYLPSVRSLLSEGLAATATEYSRARQHMLVLRHEMTSAFAETDVLVCPSTVTAAPAAATTGDPAFNSPWSYLGLPTITIPIGLDEAGLPLGIQFVGRYFDEERLFQAAAWCERVLQTP